MKSKIIKASETLSLQLFSTEEEFIDSVNYRLGENRSPYAMLLAFSDENWEEISEILVANLRLIPMAGRSYDYLDYCDNYFAFEKDVKKQFSRAQIKAHIFEYKYRYVIFLFKKRLLK